MADIIQIRRDTAANWAGADPILAQGELGLETDTDKLKVGDGITPWVTLGYLIDAGGYLTQDELDSAGYVTADQVGPLAVPSAIAMALIFG